MEANDFNSLWYSIEDHINWCLEHAHLLYPRETLSGEEDEIRRIALETYFGVATSNN